MDTHSVRNNTNKQNRRPDLGALKNPTIPPASTRAIFVGSPANSTTELSASFYQKPELTLNNGACRLTYLRLTIRLNGLIAVLRPYEVNNRARYYVMFVW